jgi:hypothetical protein
MLRLIFLASVLLACVKQLASQPFYPEGGYKNAAEVAARKPSVHFRFHPEMRSAKEIKLIGGNDYSIQSESDGADRKYIQQDLYAVSAGDSLYINTLIHKLPSGYSKALSEGRYVAFKSGFRDKKKQRVIITTTALVPGVNLLGLTTASLALLSKAKSSERYLLVLDIETEIFYLLDRNFLLKIVKDFPEIEYQYAMEPEQNQEETLVRYVSMVDKMLNH